MDEFEEAMILANQNKKKSLDRQKNREHKKRKYAAMVGESNTNCVDNDMEFYVNKQLHDENSPP